MIVARLVGCWRLNQVVVMDTHTSRGIWSESGKKEEAGEAREESGDG
jgi:hypothetical protein